MSALPLVLTEQLSEYCGFMDVALALASLRAQLHHNFFALGWSLGRQT